MIAKDALNIAAEFNEKESWTDFVDFQIEAVAKRGNFKLELPLRKAPNSVADSETARSLADTLTSAGFTACCGTTFTDAPVPILFISW